MWCATCQANVKVTPAAEGPVARCPRCNGPLQESPPDPADESADRARELLDRWSDVDLLGTPTDPPNKPQDDDATASPSPHRFRVDTAHAEDRGPVAEDSTSEASETSGASEAPGESPAAADAAAQGSSLPYGYHPAHEQAINAPHVDGSDAGDVGPASPTRGVAASFWGQLLAYGGVLGMTSGGALVIWNYFGSSPIDSPTAWLIATVGQMLLFLGVITLISGGMEQTTEEVTRQVRVLGEQLVRIERAGRSSGETAETIQGPPTGITKPK